MAFKVNKCSLDLSYILFKICFLCPQVYWVRGPTKLVQKPCLNSLWIRKKFGLCLILVVFFSKSAQLYKTIAHFPRLHAFSHWNFSLLVGLKQFFKIKVLSFVLCLIFTFSMPFSKLNTLNNLVAINLETNNNLSSQIFYLWLYLLCNFT